MSLLTFCGASRYGELMLILPNRLRPNTDSLISREIILTSNRQTTFVFCARLAMRLRVCWVVAACLSFASLPGFADAADAAAEQKAVGQFAALLQASESMRADFKHSMRDADGALLDASAGWMAWQRPDNFRWEILEPLAQTLIINGAVFYQYDRDLEQLIVQPLSPEVSALPNVLLTGDPGSIAETYHVEAIYAAQAGNYAAQSDAQIAVPMPHLFKLTPRTSGGLFTAIVVEFNNGLIAAIDIEDDLQQTSRFEFAAATTLVNTPSDIFSIDPAPGTEIIHQ